MRKFTGKLNDSFEKTNKFFGVSIQRPNPSYNTVRIGSIIGTVLGMLILIISIIAGFKWSAIGGSLVAVSNLGNLLSKKKS
ncbi:hypothetical protein AEA09_09620 [Lysinibacillus contaminans]|uniref:Uncharacterized protein n=1 Tax=Lysinibacillus contaminans TaxID=1293441 RepID=A0ABR5K1P8_9BACI|nr:hypothetical protein [Lysinibacillus contaminans]KOS68771.1 hypothetical protein AEA09_09620 [Lysinibacillus contaminans]